MFGDPISRLLREAAKQHEQDGVVDLCIQTELAGEGYVLSDLPTAIEQILAEPTEEDE